MFGLHNARKCGLSSPRYVFPTRENKRLTSAPNKNTHVVLYNLKRMENRSLGGRPIKIPVPHRLCFGLNPPGSISLEIPVKLYRLSFTNFGLKVTSHLGFPINLHGVSVMFFATTHFDFRNKKVPVIFIYQNWLPEGWILHSH